MERFEITFFCKKEAYKEIISKFIDNSAKKYFLFKESFFIEVFEDKNKDFTEIRFSISDFILTKRTYKKVFGIFSEFVSEIFAAIPDIELATGIYQLTYYFIEQEHKNCLYEFDSKFLSKFPLVIVRL